MEAENRTAPRNRFRFGIVASYAIATFLFAFPVEAFYLSVRQHVVPVTTSLFSQEENQDDQDSPIGKDEQSSQPSLRRYQGGMIPPAVIAAKLEPTSNFVKLNGIETSINRGEDIESSGMFRPNVETKSDNENSNSPLPMRVDESTITSTYVIGGMIGTETTTKITAKVDENKAGTEATPKKALKETKAKVAVKLKRYKVSPVQNIDAEAEEVENAQEELDESKEIKKKLESSEQTSEADTIKKTEEEIQSKDPETIDNTKKEIEIKPQEVQTSKANARTTVEEKDAKEIESTIKISETTEISGTKKFKRLDVSTLEQKEDEKLKAIQTKIQVRKEQQVELEKMEQDLLRKADEIKERTEALLRLEGEFARAEIAIRNDGDTSEQIPERETNEEIPHYSPREYNALSWEEKQKLREARAVIRGTSNSSDHHILGPVIVDLGYKRVHVVSSGRLGTIPIWKKQRTFKYDRAQRMAVEKKEQMHLGFPGIICLHEDAGGKLSIIDGQHRVGMMLALRESRKKFKRGEFEEDPEGEHEKLWNEQEKYFQNILVEVYSESSTGNSTQTAAKDIDYTKQVFQEINKAEPMALIDEEGLASESELKIISEAVSTLQHLYENMFIPSQRCRPPNANVNNFCNGIFGSNLLKRHEELTTGKELADWLVTQNAAMGELYEMDSEKQQLIAADAWMKASKNGFYLGLESSWLYK